MDIRDYVKVFPDNLLGYWVLGDGINVDVVFSIVNTLIDVFKELEGFIRDKGVQGHTIELGLNVIFFYLTQALLLLKLVCHTDNCT